MSDVQRQPELLPAPFSEWFAARGWSLRPHQRGLLESALQGRGGLVIAPTGGGKTLAGFLPSLVDLSRRPPRQHATLHTLYISPLKALAADVARNLMMPVGEMGLQISIDVRTGDTLQSRRTRQRARPPDIMLTTPEQLALLIASEHAEVFFRDLQAVIVDEIHAIASTKRGDMLALALSSVRTWAPKARFVGLSATVRDPAALATWLGEDTPVILYQGGAKANLEVLDSEQRSPWAGHSGRHLAHEVVFRTVLWLHAAL
jgi:ATP-dependent Lhr-like helicase